MAGRKSDFSLPMLDDLWHITICLPSEWKNSIWKVKIKDYLSCSVKKNFKMLTCEGEDGSRITRMEETIARALSVNWKEYDVPGVCSTTIT